MYQAFRSTLKGFVAKKPGDDALADDIVQDAFLKLANHCARGGESMPVGSLSGE